MERGDKFENRHIGPRPEDREKMLKVIGVRTMEELIDKTIPDDIRLDRELDVGQTWSEHKLIHEIKAIASKNKLFRTYIGMGYYDCFVPKPIVRNIFENPGWYTSYTPYQPEISQGRLESLLNYQTMIVDLTGMEIANASLLDEGTAAAEGMGMAYRVTKKKRFIADINAHPQTLAVLQTRADGYGMELEVADLHNSEVDFEGACGIYVQYPNTDGAILDPSSLIKKVHEHKGLAIVGTDLLAMTILKPPGELDADVVVGSSQRFGVPMGYGGPHAAFYATRNKYVRQLVGRMVGISLDAAGRDAYRLALQTREQHIRRDKATSNICTAQALLANMSAMYAVYHGADGLRNISEMVHKGSQYLAEGIRSAGHEILNDTFFDTLKIRPKNGAKYIKQMAEELKMNYRYHDDGSIGISLDETVFDRDLVAILRTFGCETPLSEIKDTVDGGSSYSIQSSPLKRTSLYLNHPVFKKYQSETNIVRYMKQLENKDISLVHSMIPLGSCTMKLNSTSEMMSCSWYEFADIHPFAPMDQAEGYHEILHTLERYLCEITGYAAFSLMPNSGANGEYAGLRVIMAYLKDIGQAQRKVCLIPVSAHGTNPASAIAAGMTVQPVKVTKTGAVDMKDLTALVQRYKDEIAALMVTYPSTFGVFDNEIREICNMVHKVGGQIYLDGANLNAQVGLCRPGDYGSDVSHLNLHKTFCIPHGGGGPGMGPIGVREHLVPYLPTHPLHKFPTDSPVGPVSSAPYGSSLILPISWCYIKMMGGVGLRHASEHAILNANYMMKRLDGYYNVKFTNDNGFCAHEFIIDCNRFKSAGIEVADIAKRLMDYGFHSPTMSWPVVGALMIEPTESEDKPECDRLCDALIQIRKEIALVEEGRLDRTNNPLKNAPHCLTDVTDDKWDRPYSRKLAAYPARWQNPDTKFWPTVSRIDDKHGDKVLMCTCPPVDAYGSN